MTMTATIAPSVTLIALHPEFHVFSVEPHGFKIVRQCDLVEATFYGDDQCEKFRNHFHGDEEPDDPRENEAEAKDFGDWCEREDHLPARPPLKTYSVIINWNDRDAECGTYGTTVRACNHEAAEQAARWEMWASDNDGGGDPPPDDITDEYGSCVESSEGAAWKARDMEGVLRDLLAWEHMMGGFSATAWERARAIIAEIDGKEG